MCFGGIRSVPYDLASLSESNGSRHAVWQERRVLVILMIESYRRRWEVNRMSVRQIEQMYSVMEYLALERASDERHEYLDGEIYAMAGESLQHGAICVNLTRIISTHLLGKPCQALSKDMKVRSGPRPQMTRSAKGLYSYPDLLVVCGEPQFHDQHRDVLLNPQIIIEVLSPATEAFDRGQKFMRYRTWVPSLTDYILVSQSQPLIELFTREPSGVWTIGPAASDLTASLEITSIGCSLPLSVVYDRVSFPPPDEASEDDPEED
jgi:Uma2 family endonuclease